MKRFLECLYRSYMRHNIGLLSAVIAFFSFSAMIPMVMLLIYAGSFIVARDVVEKFLIDLLQSTVPSMPMERSVIAHTVARLAGLSPSIGAIGILGLLWTTIGGFVSLQQILDTIVDAQHRRSFLVQFLVGFAMLLIFGGLTALSSLTMLVAPILDRHLPISLTFVHIVSQVSFPILLLITCYLCYRILPSRTMQNGPILIGALFSTVGIYVTRFTFVIYSRHLGNYVLIYGALAFTMLLVFWIYIISTILLIGAEIAACLTKLRNPDDPASG